MENTFFIREGTRRGAKNTYLNPGGTRRAGKSGNQKGTHKGCPYGRRPGLGEVVKGGCMFAFSFADRGRVR